MRGVRRCGRDDDGLGTCRPWPVSVGQPLGREPLPLVVDAKATGEAEVDVDPPSGVAPAVWAGG